MAKIEIPGERIPSGFRQESLDAAAAPGQASVAYGAQLQSVGQTIFDQARMQLKSLMAHDYTNKAINDVREGSKARFQQVVDKEGNPLFDSLPSDIDSLSQETFKSYLRKIKDPDVARAFTAGFNQFSEGNKVEALRTARNQQLQYAKESVQRGFDTLSKQAMDADPDLYGTYHGAFADTLKAALNGGAINQKDMSKMLEAFRSTVRGKQFKNMIDKDPEGALQRLKTDPRAIHLTGEEQQGLMKQAAKKSEGLANSRAKAAEKMLSDSHKREEFEAKKESQKVEMEANVLRAKVSYGIKANEVGEADLEELKDQIGEESYWKLKEELVTSEGKRDKKLQKISDMDQSIKNGGKLYINYSQDEVNDYFKEAITSTGATTLSEQSNIVSTMGAAPSQYISALEIALQDPDELTKQDAIEAWKMIQDSPSVTSKMSRESQIRAIRLTEAVEQGLPLGKATKIVENSLSNITSLTGENLRRKRSEVKAEDFNALVASVVDDMGLEMGDLPESQKAIIRQGVETAFVDPHIAGDKELLRKVLKANPPLEFSETTVGTGTKITGGNKTAKYAGAPESYFPGYAQPAIAPIIERDLITGITPEIAMRNSDKALTSEDDIASFRKSIKIEPLMAGGNKTEADGSQSAYYAMSRSDGLPVVDKNGMPLIYKMNTNEIHMAAVQNVEELMEGFIESARAKRAKLAGVDYTKKAVATPTASTELPAAIAVQKPGMANPQEAAKLSVAQLGVATGISGLVPASDTADGAITPEIATFMRTKIVGIEDPAKRAEMIQEAKDIINSFSKKGAQAKGQVATGVPTGMPIAGSEGTILPAEMAALVWDSVSNIEDKGERQVVLDKIHKHLDSLKNEGKAYGNPATAIPASKEENIFEDMDVDSLMQVVNTAMGSLKKSSQEVVARSPELMTKRDDIGSTVKVLSTTMNKEAYQGVVDNLDFFTLTGIDSQEKMSNYLNFIQDSSGNFTDLGAVLKDRDVKAKIKKELGLVLDNGSKSSMSTFLIMSAYMYAKEKGWR